MEEKHFNIISQCLIQRRFLLNLFASALLLSMSLSANAWWNKDWSYRTPITLDTSVTGANINETLVDVPVLIRLHSGNFADFFLLKEDLSDIRFIAGDDQTLIKHHIEKFDLINQMIFIWVKLPHLSGGINTEKVWMYYGNTEAVANTDMSGSFDVPQTAVFHFADASQMVADATAYANILELNGAQFSAASLIGSGLTFDGSGGIKIIDSASLRTIPENGMTFSAWIKPAGVQDNSIILSRSDAATSLQLVIDQSMLIATVKTSADIFTTPKTAPLTLGIWQHVALLINTKKLSIFVNGAELASIELSANEIGGDIFIGAQADTSQAFIGEIDEVRIANIPRATAWIKAAANNQGQFNTLAFANEAEQLGNANGESVLISIIHHAAEDKFGLGIIVILFLMMIASFVLMLFKGLYLIRVKKDNNRFLADYYKTVAFDPEAMDRENHDEDDNAELSTMTQAIFGKHDHYQSSPIYHIYHKGMNEVRQRVGVTVGAQAVGVINQRSMDAVRAAMDAFTVRELQKLNAKMVLLTIAISGGPFIGLLGTVIGVMITFAAIASAGDVNINAIAPGMSAALLATVAGLAVAIPALFGYNYLGSIIKDITADMRVFIDEFITRIAEHYNH